MRERKPRIERQRIVARVDKEFHELVTKCAKALGVKIQEFVVQALKTEMQAFDLRKELLILQNRFDALKDQKTRAIEERKAVQFELKEISLWLGVPNTAKDRKQAIKAIKRDLKVATDKETALREELKQVASRLGVPDTAAHCIQRIGEIAQKLEATSETLRIAKESHNAESTSKETYKKSRDHYKMRYEETLSELQGVETKLKAYRRQGFWGRLFGRVPK